jgi:hypothetical protein
MSARQLTTFAVLALITACASGSSGDTAPRGSRDLITLAEIEGVEVTNAYDLIQRLRPEMLRARGQGSFASGPTPAVVYLDGVKHGQIGELRSMPKEVVTEIRYINGPDATTRFGTGHMGGAILITSRR